MKLTKPLRSESIKKTQRLIHIYYSLFLKPKRKLKVIQPLLKISQYHGVNMTLKQQQTMVTCNPILELLINWLCKLIEVHKIKVLNYCQPLNMYFKALRLVKGTWISNLLLMFKAYSSQIILIILLNKKLSERQSLSRKWYSNLF